MSLNLPETAAAPPAESRSRPMVVVAAVSAAGLFLGLAVLFSDLRLLVVMAAVVAASVLVLRYPFAAVLLYLVAAAVHPEELGLAPVFLHLERILALVCVAALTLPQLLRRTWTPWRWVSTDWCLLAVGAAACLAVPASVSRPWALNGCYELAKLGFVYATVRYSATTPRRLRAVVIVMLLVGAYAALMSLRSVPESQQHVWEHAKVRVMGPTSTTGDPNSLANVLVALLPFGVLLARIARRVTAKIFYAAVAALLLYAMALTGARASAVSLLVMLLVMILASRRRLVAAALAVAALGVAWMVTPPDLKARYLTLKTYQQEATYQGRVHNLKLGLQMLRDRPLTGCGVTCFIIARVEEYDGKWSDAHNLVAQVGSEMGLPGLAAFALFVVVTLASARHTRRLLRGLGPGPAEDYLLLDRLAWGVTLAYIALLVQGMASHNFLQLNFYLGAAIAANAALLARDARRHESQVAPSAEVAQ